MLAQIPMRSGCRVASTNARLRVPDEGNDAMNPYTRDDCRAALVRSRVFRIAVVTSLFLSLAAAAAETINVRPKEPDAPLGAFDDTVDVAFTGNGDTLLILGVGSVAAWDLATGERRLVPMPSSMHAIGGGTLAVSSYVDIEIRDAVSLELRRSIASPAQVQGLAISEDGGFVAALETRGGGTAFARVFNTSTGALAATHEFAGVVLETAEHKSFAVRADGGVVLAAKTSGGLPILLTSDGGRIQIGSSWAEIALSPDGRRAAVVQMEDVAIWDVSAARVETFATDIGGTASFSADGTTLLVASQRMIRLLDANTLRPLTLLTVPDGLGDEISLGRGLAASVDDVVRLWDLAKRRELVVIAGGASEDWLAVTPDGRHDSGGKGAERLILPTPASQLRTEDLIARVVRGDLPPSPVAVRLAIAAPPTPLITVRSVVAGGVANATVDVQTTSPLDSITLIHRGRPVPAVRSEVVDGGRRLSYAIAVRPGRQSLQATVLTRDERRGMSDLLEFDVQSAAADQAPELVLGGADSLPRVAAFNRDASLLAVAGSESWVTVWDVATRRVLSTLPLRAPTRHLAFDPTGILLATVTGQAVSLWDAARGEKTQSFVVATTGGDPHVAFLDGERLAVARDGWLLVRHLGREAFIGGIDIGRSSVTGLAASGDGRVCAVSHYDGSVSVLDLAAGKVRYQFRPGGVVESITLSRDASAALVATRDGAISEWALLPVAAKRGAQRVDPTGRAPFFSAARNADAFVVADDSLRDPIFTNTSGSMALRLPGGKGAGAVALDPAGRIAAIATPLDGAVYLYQTADGALIGRLAAPPTPAGYTVGFSADNRWLLSGRGKTFLGWDLSSARAQSRPILDEFLESLLTWSRNGRRAATIDFAAGSPTLVVLDAPDGTVRRYPNVVGQALPGGVALSGDGNRVAVVDITMGARAVTILDVATWARVAVVPVPDDNMMRSWELALDEKGETLAVSQTWSPALGERFGTTELGETRDLVSFWRVGTAAPIQQLATDGRVGVSFGPDGTLAALSTEEGIVQLWNWRDARIVRAVDAGAGSAKSSFSSDNRRLVTMSGEGIVRLWDVADGAHVASFAGTDASHWIATKTDGSYFATRDAASRISFRLGGRAYAFDQFDLRYNRPDAVLSALGGEPALVTMYRAARERRLRRVSGDSSEAAPALPSIKLRRLPAATRERTVTVSLSASDPAHDLERLLIYVNGVPVGGSGGIQLERSRSVTLERTIPLSAGENALAVSVVNVAGVESLRERTVVTSQAEAKPSLWLLAVGVSRYRDDRFSLQWAAKDAQDLADLFAARRDVYESIHLIPLLNEDATAERILEARHRLSQASVDDHVIIFFAGHGLLGTGGDQTYYFATHDMEFSDPAARGLSYTDIEKLLDSTQSRQKLLLMDTCHSGELDPAEAKGASLGPNVRATPGQRGVVLTRPVTLARSEEVLRTIFSDVRRDSGAVIVAAAAGLSYSLEMESLQNGVFTSAILEGLRKSAADRDGDAVVRVSELRDYVLARTRELTGGQQTPVVRRENLEHDFRVY
jgi:WD40 repeat protein/uncharacterized caspase-like protein